MSTYGRYNCVFNLRFRPVKCLCDLLRCRDDHLCVNDYLLCILFSWDCLGPPSGWRVASKELEEVDSNRLQKFTQSLITTHSFQPSRTTTLFVVLFIYMYGTVLCREKFEREKLSIENSRIYIYLSAAVGCPVGCSDFYFFSHFEV